MDLTDPVVDKLMAVIGQSWKDRGRGPFWGEVAAHMGWIRDRRVTFCSGFEKMVLSCSRMRVGRSRQPTVTPPGRLNKERIDRVH